MLRPGLGEGETIMKHRLRGILISICVAIGLLLAAGVPVVKGSGTPWMRPYGFDLVAWTSQTVLGWVIVGFIAWCCASLCGVRRWKLLLEAQHMPLPFSFLLGSWFRSSAVGFFLPSIVGREFFRIFESSLKSRDIVRSTAVVAVEKGAGIIAFSLLSLLIAPVGFWALAVSPAKLRLAILLGVLFCASLFVLAVLFRPLMMKVFFSLLPFRKKFGPALNRWVDAMLAYRQHPALIGKAVLWSMAVQVCLAVSVMAALMAFRSPETPLINLLAVAPLLNASPFLGFALVGQSITEVVGEHLLVSVEPRVAIFSVWALLWASNRALPGFIGVFVYALQGFSKRALAEPKVDQSSRWLLTADECGAHRRNLANCLFAGAAGGLLAGAATGILESTWMYRRWIAGAAELHMFWWGPIAYGLAFITLGVGFSVLLSFIYLAVGLYRSPGGTLALCFAASLASALVIIGRFRYARDVLGDHPLNMIQIACLLGIALFIFIALERFVSVLLSSLTLSRFRAGIATLGVFALAVAGGFLFDRAARVQPPPIVFAPTVEAQGPNVIFIIADTLRADFLPAYNEGAEARTPSLDEFVADSVLFTKSFSQAPWTKPSFGTLFTGLYPDMHGATGKASILPEKAVTLAEILADNGYFTQGLPNNRNLLPEYGLQQGFIGYDFLVPELYFGASLTAEQLALYQVLRRIKIRLRAPRLEAEHFYRPAGGVNEAVGTWLDGPTRPEDVPFFLYLHYMDPHDPYMVADQPNTGYGSTLLGVYPDPDQFREVMVRAYNDEIERVDRALGALFEDLKRRGLYEDSLIVFTSDHGEEFFDHGGWYHGPTVYEEVTHVPIILKLPRGRLAGAVNPGIARHVDIAPTILDQAGLPVPEEMFGIPLVYLESGSPLLATKHSFAQTNFLNVVAESIRTHDAKLIRANEANPRGLAPVEFYDLDSDPGERVNRAGGGDPRQEELDAVLKETLKSIEESALR